MIFEDPLFTSTNNTSITKNGVRNVSHCGRYVSFNVNAYACNAVRKTRKSPSNQA